MESNKKITRVEGGSAPATDNTSRTFVPTAESKGRASQLRLWAVLLWVLAIGAEVAAIITLQKHATELTTNVWFRIIGAIVLDLALVIFGSSLWKKANRLDPASEKEPVKFFIQNQLGAIIAVIAFLPLVLMIFTNKNLDGKTKGILGGVAALALVVAGLTSADFNPPSVEQYTEQTNRVEWLNDGHDFVYWTKSGTHYHLYKDCPHINSSRTDEIFEGTVAQARELKNITDLCKTCEKRAIKDKNLNEADYQKTE